MKKQNKKKLAILLGTCLFTVLLFGLFYMYYNVQPKKVDVEMQIKSTIVEEYQIFYDTTGDKVWKEENSVKHAYSNPSQYETLKFSIPEETKNIRINVGKLPKVVEVKELKFVNEKEASLNYKDIQALKGKKNDLKIQGNSDSFLIESIGNNPFIEVLNIEEYIQSITKKSNFIAIFMIVMSLILGFVFTLAISEFKEVLRFFYISIKNRKLIKELSKNDFKNKYASSYLGIIWGFIQPLVTICVYWFVFQVAFRSGDVGNMPFILWFIAGIIPWFYFSEALPSTTSVFLEYSYLVKKVVFKIEILPMVKILSSLFVHLFFVLFIFVIMAIYGYYPDIYSIQFIYYSLAMVLLIFSISIFTSAVILFFRDLGQIVNIIISVGFWATPIGWQLNILPDWAARIFKLNPMYYIVTGYRDSFVDKIFFWQKPYETIYFWAFCFVILCLAVKMFNKLKPHFSDVI